VAKPRKYFEAKIQQQLLPGGQNWYSCEPEPKNRMHGSFWRHTPCEVLRHTYEMLDSPNPNIEEVQYQLRIAVTMAKCLARRLTIYEGRGWGRKIYPMTPWWDPNKKGCVLPGNRG